MVDSKKSLITDKLKPFIKSLAGVRTEYQRVLVQIATELPAMEEDIDSKTAEAREALEQISSNRGDQDPSELTRKFLKFQNELSEAINLFVELDEQDKLLFNDFQASMVYSASIIKKMDHILSISEELKVFAINSIVYSNNIGIQGKGYQIISSEFINLSQLIADKTSAITRLGNEIESMIEGRLYTSINNHNEVIQAELQSLRIKSYGVFDRSRGMIDQFYDRFLDLLDNLNVIKKPVSSIMGDIQKQDIIQQQLEHLLESIEDVVHIVETHPQDLEDDYSIQDEDSREEHLSVLTLLHILVVNTETQMGRINQDLIEMVESLETSFIQMNSAIEETRKEKDRFVRHKNSENSFIESIFEPSRSMVDEANKNLKNIMIQKKEIIQSFSEIVYEIAEEKNHAKSFIPVIESINNLLLLARIESARYVLNISGLEEKSSQGFTQESIEELLKVVTEIGTSYQQVMDNLKSAKTQEMKQIEENRSIENNLNESIATLTESRNLFFENYENLDSIIEELFTNLQNYLSLFDVLKQLYDQMVKELSVCKEIRQYVDKKLEAIGGEVSLENCRFKDVILQKIVDKWTVKQEREMMKERLDSLEIEDSAESSITLF